MLELFSVMDWMMRWPQALPQRLRQDVFRLAPLSGDIHHLLTSTTLPQLTTRADRILDANRLGQEFGRH